jgi:tetratricopeptide (TPR) repeat protein
VLLSCSLALAAPKAAPAPAPKPIVQAPAGDIQLIKSGTACTDDEAWNLAGNLPPTTVERFTRPPRKRDEAFNSILDAVALRLVARKPQVQRFAEYWMWRALYQLKLVHLSHVRFNGMLDRGFSQDGVHIQMAALDCINRIHQRFPSLTITDPVAEKIITAPAGTFRSMDPVRGDRAVALEAIAMYTLERLNKPDAKQSEVAPELAFLDQGGAFEALVKGQIAASSGFTSHAIRHAENFFKIAPLPDAARRFEDLMHLNLARVYYGSGQFDGAIKEYKKVHNTSNLFAASLTELGWAQLQRKLYSDSIGSAYNLMAGGLAHSFAPEAPIVMAISHFETCHYPEAYQALKYFRKNFEISYRWLKSWDASPEKDTLKTPYKILVDYLKTKTTAEAPMPIVTEWVRSPVFVSNQIEINLLFDERDTTNYLLRGLSRTRFKSRQRQQAAGALQGTLAKFVKELPKLEPPLIDRINTDLKARTKIMLTQMNQALENSQLIEIEVFNAAGNDMIMQNAQPEAKQAQKDGERKVKRADEGPTLDWGRFPAKEGEASEVWEDELGGLRTNVTDSCPH